MKTDALKLDPSQRAEVNRLIAECNDDLEAALFQLVGERDIYRSHLEMVAKICRSKKHKDPISDILCECNRATRIVTATNPLTRQEERLVMATMLGVENDPTGSTHVTSSPNR